MIILTVLSDIAELTPTAITAIGVHTLASITTRVRHLTLVNIPLTITPRETIGTVAPEVPIVVFGHTLRSVLTQVRGARIELDRAVDTRVGKVAGTLITVDEVDTVTVKTRVVRAFIDVVLTICA